MAASPTSAITALIDGQFYPASSDQRGVIQKALQEACRRASVFGVAKKLQLLSANFLTVRLWFKVTHELSTRFAWSDWTAGTGDETLSRYESDQQLVRTRQQLEANLDRNAATILEPYFESHPARGFADHQLIRNLGIVGRPVNQIETCPPCGGHGAHLCNTCSGAGEHYCSQCNGTSRRRCNGCSGTGLAAPYRVVRNGQYQSVQPYCGYCGGARQVVCWCSNGVVTCQTCSGHGQLSCSPCGGSGYQHRIGCFEIVHVASSTLSYSTKTSASEWRLIGEQIKWSEMLQHSAVDNPFKKLNSPNEKAICYQATGLFNPIVLDFSIGSELGIAAAPSINALVNPCLHAARIASELDMEIGWKVRPNRLAYLLPMTRGRSEFLSRAASCDALHDALTLGDSASGSPLGYLFGLYIKNALFCMSIRWPLFIFVFLLTIHVGLHYESPLVSQLFLKGSLLTSIVEWKYWKYGWYPIAFLYGYAFFFTFPVPHRLMPYWPWKTNALPFFVSAGIVLFLIPWLSPYATRAIELIAHTS